MSSILIRAGQSKTNVGVIQRGSTAEVYSGCCGEPLRSSLRGWRCTRCSEFLVYNNTLINNFSLTADGSPKGWLFKEWLEGWTGLEKIGVTILY